MELLTSGRFFVRDVPTLALRRINGDSAGNYHLMDEETTGGIVIPTIITSSIMKNQPEECLFRWELPAQGRGIHWRNGIPPGITSSETSTPPMEGDSAGNHQLIYADSEQ
jgi:hypothetical protein